MRELLVATGMSDDAIHALFARLPAAGFQRGRPEEIAWQAHLLLGAGAGDTVVRARPLVRHAGALEVFVHSPDRDGLFAAIVATLDRLGLAIQQARLLDGPASTVFDTFEVVPAEGHDDIDPTQVERQLSNVLSTSDLDTIRPARRARPRHLRHFRIPPQVRLEPLEARDGHGARTLLALVSTDRPGLLADVSHALRRQRLRVHDARIATFGERAEDFFQITDEHDRALDDPQRQQALRESLLACLEGDASP